MTHASERWQICPILGLRDVRAAVDVFMKRLGFHLNSAFEPDAREGMVYAILSRGGAEILEAPHDQPYGMRELTVAATEGHVIAFGSEPR